MGPLGGMKTVRQAELADPDKLELIIAEMLASFKRYNSKSSAVIGVSGQQVLALTLYSHATFEAEFGEDVDGIDRQDICVTIHRTPSRPPRPLSKG
ncbi:hypothetical protein ACIF2R_01530 [Serratia marcescens]|uniref:hypothetical protein n=1 Tax=Serratia marcescens TaxID=615 RepID=UPI0037CCCCAC